MGIFSYKMYEIKKYAVGENNDSIKTKTYKGSVYELYTQFLSNRQAYFIEITEYQGYEIAAILRWDKVSPCDVQIASDSSEILDSLSFIAKHRQKESFNITELLSHKKDYKYAIRYRGTELILKDTGGSIIYEPHFYYAISFDMDGREINGFCTEDTIDRIINDYRVHSIHIVVPDALCANITYTDKGTKLMYVSQYGVAQWKTKWANWYKQL